MSTPPQQRIIWMDVLRVLSCLLVCLIHSPLASCPSIWSPVYTYIATPCIGLFFMLSGALLFPVPEDNLKDFYKRKARRILPKLLFWSLIIILARYLSHRITEESAIISIASIPFHAAHGYYWFLYVILGIYMIAPVISSFVTKKSHCEIYLIFWCCSIILPYLNTWIPGCFNVDGDFYNMFGYFGGYLGYVVLGYYLKQYPVKPAFFITRILPVASIFIIGIPLLFRENNPFTPPSLIYSYLSINGVSLTIVYFLFIQNIRLKNNYLCSIIKHLSICSFGIYLTHVLILEYYKPYLESLNLAVSPFITIPISAIIVFSLSYTIVLIMKQIPGLKQFV